MVLSIRSQMKAPYHLRSCYKLVNLNETVKLDSYRMRPEVGEILNDRIVKSFDKGVGKCGAAAHQTNGASQARVGKVNKRIVGNGQRLCNTNGHKTMS